MLIYAPSRLCLFGEHLDYLSLEVVSLTIDLKFFSEIKKRNDGLVVINIKDSSIDTLNQKNQDNLYEKYTFDLNEKITYNENRDYFASSLVVLKKHGYDISSGFDIKMDSNIPIGKGMCSSSTMITVFIKSILEIIECEDKDDKFKLAQMAYEAEVVEFNEPGGKMDHMASAFGGICHFDFLNQAEPVYENVNYVPKGDFILVDSKQQKDTLKVLKNAKDPVVKASKIINDKYNMSIRELLISGKKNEIIDSLDKSLRKPLNAAIDNYGILKTFLNEIDTITSEKFGSLLKRHHENLRDGLGISTKIIENILNTAYSNNALGGKINGSGGGGCCYIYCHKKDTKNIISAINKKGYPTKIVKVMSGAGLEK